MGALMYLDKIVKVNLKQPPFKRSDSMKVSSHSKHTGLKPSNQMVRVAVVLATQA